jgi:hypothetical protein
MNDGTQQPIDYRIESKIITYPYKSMSELIKENPDVFANAVKKEIIRFLHKRKIYDTTKSELLATHTRSYLGDPIKYPIVEVLYRSPKGAYFLVTHAPFEDPTFKLLTKDDVADWCWEKDNMVVLPKDVTVEEG